MGGEVTRKPYLVGHQEFAALYDVEAQMVSQWLSRGVLDADTAAVISASRYWPLGFAARFGQTTPRPKQLRLDVKALLMEEQGPGEEVFSRHQLPPIVGQHEVVVLFHLPAQANLAMTIRTGRFPKADWLLSGSPLWLLDTVLGAASDLKKTSRTLPWDVDPEVVDALRERRYGGPGSAVASRGPRASR